ESTGGWQRRAEIVLQCDPDPSREGCAVGGVLLTSAPSPIVKVPGTTGAPLSFAVTDVFPAAPPERVGAVVRFSSVAEAAAAIRAGDRDDCLDDRAAVVIAVGDRRSAERTTTVDVSLTLGVDEAVDGLKYRGGLLKTGAPFTLTTDRYVVTGTVLRVRRDEGRQ